MPFSDPEATFEVAFCTMQIGVCVYHANAPKDFALKCKPATPYMFVEAM